MKVWDYSRETSLNRTLWNKDTSLNRTLYRAPKVASVYKTTSEIIFMKWHLFNQDTLWHPGFTTGTNNYNYILDYNSILDYNYYSLVIYCHVCGSNGIYKKWFSWILFWILEK